MPKKYMVTSSFVCRACYVNIMLLVLLFISELIFRYTKFSSMIRMSIYTSGILTNIMVILQAERKLEDIVKLVQHNCIAIMDKVKQMSDAIYCHVHAGLLSLLLTKDQILQTLKDFVMSKFASTSFKYPRQTEYVTTGFVRTSKIQTLPRESFLSPEVNAALKSVARPQSDPVRKLQRSSSRDRAARAQSPELFKNKIYKSRMNLASGLER